MSPGEFDALVRGAIDDGAKIVLLDSLNGYLNAMAEERQVLLKLHELLAYLGEQNVLTADAPLMFATTSLVRGADTLPP